MERKLPPPKLRSDKPAHESIDATAIVAERLNVNVARQFPDKRRTRITMITKLHHERYGEQPESATTSPYTEFLVNDEQAYVRILSVAQEWTKIDFGWIKEMGCAFVCLRNAFKVKRLTEPTEAEREDDLSRILEVGKVIGDKTEPLLALYVGQEVVISPLGSLDSWVIRCRHGSGRYSVFAIANDPE
jgi:hypothetical protein